MSKREFLESLREHLSYELPERLVSENLTKYEEYFDEQLKTGRSPSEISEELGDPKLIARSCIDAEKSGADGIPNSEDDPDFASEIDREQSKDRNRNGDTEKTGGEPAGNTRVYTSKGCLIPILVLIVIVILIIIFFASGLWLWVILGALIISAITALIRMFTGK